MAEEPQLANAREIAGEREFLCKCARHFENKRAAHEI